MIAVRLMGVRQAERFLRQVEGGIREAAGTSIQGGSPLPYFWGVHFGRKRNGQLARKAGGAFMFIRAYQAVGPSVPGIMGRAMAGGPERVRNAQRGITSRITFLARGWTPVRKGDLRGSLFTRTGPRAEARRAA